MTNNISILIGRARDITNKDNWFKDSDGRYALFRGVNFASRAKLPPYLPILPLDVKDKKINENIINKFHQELQVLKNEFDYMQQLGFNIVRLLVVWKAIEPEKNTNPEILSEDGIKYLELVKEIIDALYERGIYVIIDFHQDIAHEIYGGDGFPDWALSIDEKYKQFIQPADLKNPTWFLRYNDPLVQHTLSCFWKNMEVTEKGFIQNQSSGPRTHLEKTIGATARFFQSINNGKGHPAILGYELFNEPYPIGLDMEEFEKKTLPEYYVNTLREIRSPQTDGNPGDENSFVFVEPRMDLTAYFSIEYDFGLLDFLTKHFEWSLDLSAFFNERVVFSFHYYDSGLFIPLIPKDMDIRRQEWPKLFQRMRDAAIKRNAIPFLTEFGASQDWKENADFLFSTSMPLVRVVMDLLYKQVESTLLNATYWNYDLYNTQNEHDNWNLENFSLLGPNREPRNQDIVARPYPMRSSAKPTFLWFDLNTKYCVVKLTGFPVDAPTMIYIPSSIHYPDGFKVHATSETIRWDDDHQILFWFPDKNCTLHQIIICPSNSLDKDILPRESYELLSSTTLRHLIS